MTTNGDVIQRASFMDRFSEASHHLEKFDLDTILSALRSGKNIVDIAIEYGLLKEGSNEEEHLRRDWYNETGQGWWPTIPVAETIRAGYIEVIEKVRFLGLPVDALWLVTSDTAFRVVITDSPAQITMIIETPPVVSTDAQPEPGREDDSITVIEPNPEAVPILVRKGRGGGRRRR